MAKRARVSSTTVGYVLNGTKGQTISAATTRRVLEAARDLHYQPHRSAQNLARGASDVVLVILPDWPSSESFTASLEAASALLAEAGLSCLTQVEPPAGHRPAWRSIEPLLVAGLVPFSAEDTRDMTAAGVAHILTLMSQEIADGAQLQAEHLVAEGHQVLGYAESTDPRLAGTSAVLAHSFVRTAKRLGLPSPIVRPVGLFDDSAGRAIEDWRSEGVTAVGGFSDEVAAAVLRELRVAGLSAPDDLAVIGHDDSPLARLVTPRLSSIAVDAPAYGRHMAQIVLATIEGKDPPPVDHALFTLMPRDSSVASADESRR